MTDTECCKRRIIRFHELDLPPAGVRELDVLPKYPVLLRVWLGELQPFVSTHQQLRLRNLSDATDVVKMQVGENDLVDVGSGDAEAFEIS